MTYYINTLGTYNFHINIFKAVWFVICKYLLGYLGIIILFNTVRYYGTYLSKFTRIGNSLQYIGRRTLDIYLLHYFFLPTLPMVGFFLRNIRIWYWNWH